MHALIWLFSFVIMVFGCGGGGDKAASVPSCAQPGEVLVNAAGGAVQVCASSVGTGGMDPVLTKLTGDTLLLSPGAGALLYRSHDLGESWQELDPTGVHGDSGQRLHPYLDRDVQSGRVFFNYYNLASGAPDCGNNSGTSVWSSDDDGDTWKGHSVGCGSHDWGKVIHGPAPTPALRAELQTSGYPNLVYMCATGPTIIIGPEVMCFRSSDGGQSYTKVTSPADSTDNTQLLHPVAFPQAGVVAADGTIFKSHASEQGPLLLKISRDGGLTWQKKPVSEAQLIGNYTNFLSSNLALDGQGTLYLVWVDDRDLLPYLSVSKDQGDSWSPRVKVSASEVLRGAYPNISAFAPGYVAIAYYGSLQAMGTGDGYTNADGLDYHAYLSVSKAADTAAPAFVTARINALAAPVVSGWSASISEYLGPPVLTSEGTIWATYVNKDSALIGRLRIE